MADERLQKILSAAGAASRRAAEQLIVDGRVSVNGVTVCELGTRADAGRDDIRLDGRRLSREAPRYLLLNKPERVVTTRVDPRRRATVIDLLVGVREAVYPVGRLDYDSSGLLILTNDGDLAARLMHPRHGLEKVYRATVRGVPGAAPLARLARGIPLDGRLTRPAAVTLVATPRGRGEHTAVIEIGIREGRNRQVRRMCDAIGHPVERLVRIAIGPVRDRTLRVGQFRDLTPREVDALRLAVSTAPRGDER